MIENDWAAIEHRLGVLPLLDAFFEPRGALDDVVAGRKLGALGLFTPTPEPGWGAGAIAGERSGEGILLRGDVRLPYPAADGSIVLVRLGDAEHRLAWLDHGAPGVERRGSRSGGPVGHGPCWLHIDGATAGPDLVSRPVRLTEDGELWRCLETYASGWASAAASCARDGVRALRRAARTSGFNASQLVALGITEVEIEADLTAAAVQRTGGLAVAVAAGRTLRAVAAKTEELRDVFGLEIDSLLATGSTKILTAFLGGSLLLESELARALGIREEGR
ncbi:MAG TPA: hypothetical protein VE685_01035 [Thermoanaerobaculia bacterium]|nr:hypothetical protein [Thermoanaerobaculia bacterium]